MFPSSVFPTSLFPGSIFPGPGKLPVQSTGVLFPRSLFPTSLFPISLFPDSSAAPVIIPVGSDYSIYLDIVQRLQATHAFTAVLAFEEQPPASADLQLLAIVIPGEETDNDDYDPIEYETIGNYFVEIRVRCNQPRERYRLLSIACNATRNALNHVSLAGITVPYKTQIRKKTIPKQKNPEQSIRLDGTWAILTNEGEFDESGGDSD